MFTGIVEGLCPVVVADFTNDSLRLELDLGALADGVSLGDSIAVMGCCLTVAELQGTKVSFHLMGQTLSLTNFSSVQVGHTLNVERSLRVGDRLGGHFVSGHVDGRGDVLAVKVDDEAGQTEVTVNLPDACKNQVVDKGSIGIDGVSLTLARIEGAKVTVCLIPHTLEVTSLGRLKPGDQVHLEMDMIGKWVKQLLPEGPSQ